VEIQAQERTHIRVRTVIVNGRPRQIRDDYLSYLEAVQLAYPGEVPSDTVVFTVTYSYRTGGGGSLVAGQAPVDVKDGMILNVRKTDQS